MMAGEAASMLRHQVARVSVVLSVSVVGACASNVDTATLHTFQGSIMGTTFSVKVVEGGRDPGQIAALQASAEQTLTDIDEKMSTYRPDSEVSRFNRWKTTEPFHVSPDTLAVFQHALDISTLTHGAFDVTVGPLVDAWGFGPDGSAGTFPTDADLDRLRGRVGYRRLELDAIASTIRKLDPMLECDLSALAKGYAVDRVAEMLGAEGVEGFLVEVGGEIRTRGRNERGQLWRIAIERPVNGPPVVHRLVALSDLALATSGDYRNYYEIDGRQVSHTIDPRTGRPVDHDLASVSVIELSCVRADAIATALSVLGPDDAYTVAVKENWAALLIGWDADGTMYERETPAFAAHVAAADRLGTAS